MTSPLLATTELLGRLPSTERFARFDSRLIACRLRCRSADVPAAHFFEGLSLLRLLLRHATMRAAWVRLSHLASPLFDGCLDSEARTGDNCRSRMSPTRGGFPRPAAPSYLCHSCGSITPLNRSVDCADPVPFARRIPTNNRGFDWVWPRRTQNQWSNLTKNQQCSRLAHLVRVVGVADAGGIVGAFIVECGGCPVGHLNFQAHESSMS